MHNNISRVYLIIPYSVPINYNNEVSIDYLHGLCTNGQKHLPFLNISANDSPHNMALELWREWNPLGEKWDLSYLMTYQDNQHISASFIVDQRSFNGIDIVKDSNPQIRNVVLISMDELNNEAFVNNEAFEHPSTEYCKYLYQNLTFSKICENSLEYLAISNIYKLWRDVINNKALGNSKRELGLMALLRARDIRTAQSMCIKIMNNKKLDNKLRQTAVAVLTDLLSKFVTEHGIHKLKEFIKNEPSNLPLPKKDLLEVLYDDLDNLTAELGNIIYD